MKNLNKLTIKSKYHYLKTLQYFWKSFFQLIDGTQEADRIIREGAFDYLFGSPELLVGDSSFRDQLLEFGVSTIVVDEFHTIASWYVTYFFLAHLSWKLKWAILITRCPSSVCL